MSILPPTTGARSGGLTDADIRHLVEVFTRSGCGVVDLRYGSSRLRLSRPEQGSAGHSHETVSITAPYVGTFAATTGVGRTVAVGERLGSIRSLRHETEVSATQGGTVTGQLATNDAFVAFGAPLFTIRTDTPNAGQTA